MKKQIEINQTIVDVEILEQNPRFVLFNLDGKEYTVKLNQVDDYKLHLSMNHENKTITSFDSHYVIDGVEFQISSPKRSRSKIKNTDHGQMTSPMPGKILKIMVKEGSIVEVGTPILVMEAMKMEHTIKASKNGQVEKIYFAEGDQVQGGVELVKLC